MQGVLAEYEQEITGVSVDGELRRLFSMLPPLTAPVPTRELFLQLGDGWTAFFDNFKLGSDPAGKVAVLSGRLQTTGLRLTIVSDTLGAHVLGQKKGTYGATIFEAFEGSRHARRSIACANDGGRWVFEQAGSPYGFEDLACYERKRISDRFPPELLERYAREFGADAFSDVAYLDQNRQAHGVLFERIGTLPKSPTYISLADARRARGIR